MKHEGVINAYRMQAPPRNMRRVYAVYRDKPCSDATKLKAILCGLVVGKDIGSRSMGIRKPIVFQKLKLKTINTVASEILRRSPPAGILGNVGPAAYLLGQTVLLSFRRKARIRLASQIGSQLVGVIYVSQTASIGLPTRQRQAGGDALPARGFGNSVIVVEHVRKYA